MYTCWASFTLLGLTKTTLVLWILDHWYQILKVSLEDRVGSRILKKATAQPVIETSTGFSCCPQKNVGGLLGQLNGIPGVSGHQTTGTWYFAQNKTEHGQGY